MLFTLFFLSIVTPFEVAFLPPAPDYNALFWVNRVCDTVFIVDMLLNFVLMYMEEDTTGIRWVSSPRQIAMHYLRTWFALDLFAMAPSAVDFLNRGVDGAAVHAADDAGVPTARNLMVLRVLRALRLFKLLRLIRAMRVIKRWAARVSLGYGTVIMIKCIIKILFACHWFACAFRLSANFASGPSTTWMATFGYCSDARELSTPGHVVIQGAADDALVCLDAGGMYIVAFYWSVMIITVRSTGPPTWHTARDRALVRPLLKVAPRC